MSTLETIKEELKAISNCQHTVDKSLTSMVNTLEDKIYSIMTVINEIESTQMSSTRTQISTPKRPTAILKTSQTLPFK